MAKKKEFDIDKIAELARVKLEEKEKEKLARDLESILGYVKKLNEVDSTKIPPTSHVLPLKNVFREDKAISTSIKEELLKYAPLREKDFFKVPKVIESE